MNGQTDQDSVSKLFGKPTGPLGFGTGPIGLARDRWEGVKLLDAALDSGITYFDTARLYADGRAEAMVADAFAHKRDKVIITTKAGILPPDYSLGVRVRDKLKVIARKAPPLRPMVEAPKPREPVFNVFDLPRLRASVETSLAALRTDYVDSLLLHECDLAAIQNPEVTGFLEGLKKEGKIRAWGVAATVPAMTAIAFSGQPFGAIAQFASSAFEDNVGRIKLPPGVLRITHTSLAKEFAGLATKLQSTDVAHRWRAATGAPAADVSTLARLFLRYAVQRNPGGIVLFSTTNLSRIAGNVRAAEKNDVEDKLAASLQSALAAIAS